MNGQSIITRLEKKYEISAVDSIKLKNLLSKTLKEDTNNKGTGYMVRSLYFDTFYNNDYFDKIDGFENRRKIRIRTYDLESDNLKLELKEKDGEYQYKHSLIISKEVAQKIIKCDFSVLKELNNEFANRMYNIMTTELYMPRAIVEYDRLAYIADENSTRITIDSNLRYSESNLDIFSKDLILNPVTELIVLEVKYNEFLLSYIKYLVDSVDKTQISVSKYCMSRKLSYI